MSMPDGTVQSNQTTGTGVTPGAVLQMSGHNVSPPPHLTDEMKTKVWRIWKEQWKDYAIVGRINDQPTDNKAAIFRGCLGAKGREIFDGLPFAQESDREDVGQVLKLLDSYFGGKVNITPMMSAVSFWRETRENQSRPKPLLRS